MQVEHVPEAVSTVYRGGVELYNWIQRRQPRLHQLYWRFMELEDLWKPGTVLFGRSGLIRLLKQARPDLLISTHPHLNRGHFDLAKRVLGPGLRCVTCTPSWLVGSASAATGCVSPLICTGLRRWMCPLS